MHHYQDLISIFNDCFFEKYNTVLALGEDEPIYLPANEHRPHHTLIFAHGFFSSALHECSHWLIAGEERRKLVDFGYWYAPDGRNAQQQEMFQKVEVKPQAIEWMLSKAAGYLFRVSLDNLNSDPIDSTSFKDAIYAQVKTYSLNGLPERVQRLRQALCQFYGTPLEFRIEDFERSALD